MNNEDTTFPNQFVWGVATSAYQIEGACSENGKGMSVWDDFCLKENSICNGDSGTVACDHYHRFVDDVSAIRDLGSPAYRFSISWPRVIPDGIGDVNQPGLDYYDALVDELLAGQIEPWITLFHWDYPLALFQRGGWLNPESPRWFADYVGPVVDRLSDRVQNWITINEPQCFLKFGHADGIDAPGLTLDFQEQLLACHHTLLAHGLGVSAIREKAKKKPFIGWAPVADVKIPATDGNRDLAAARQATMSVCPESLWNNTWYNDPVFFGKYPEEGIQAYGQSVPKYSSKEMEIISAPIDFLGLNIYTGSHVSAVEPDGYRELTVPPGTPRTTTDWPVVEESLYWGPKFHWERYKTPIYITENGMANVDWIDMDGIVWDPQRIDYTKRHLLQLRRCIEEQIDVRGYFHWSLLDNFEWSKGFSKRFGLIYVDFQTQRRVMKQAAYWYKDVIASNGRSLRVDP